MTSSKTKQFATRGAIVVVSLVVLAFGYRGFSIWNKTRDVLPAFSPVPPGPRGPADFSLLGLRPGVSTFADVSSFTTSLGLPCRDSSMRGLMRLGRSEAQAKIEEAKAHGDDPDAVSGASRAGYYSKKEQNPQVQWTCEDVDLTGFPGSAYGADPRGDVMLVFDSKDLPLRYVMVSRHYLSQKAAIAARQDSLARFAVLGPPTSTIGGEPNPDPTQKAFERRRPFQSEWLFADRKATVSAMNFGPPKGIILKEIYEVPWPTVVEAPSTSTAPTAPTASTHP